MKRVAALAVIIAGLGASGFAALWHRDHLPALYDTTADYTYRFSPGGVNAVEVDLDARGLTLPADSAAFDTSLLELHVDSSWLGGWLEPYIDVSLDGEPLARQYLERGAAGRRYLNLTPAATRPGAAGRALSLEGTRVGWRSGKTQLLRFANPPVEGRRALILSPHPDDGEIGAFGLYARTETTYAGITAGEEVFPDGYEELGEPTESIQHLKGVVRVLDSLSAPVLAGVAPERIVNLGYFDGTLGDMYANPELEQPSRSLGTRDLGTFRRLNHSRVLQPPGQRSRWADLVADLAYLVAQTRPQIAATPHPLLDDHPDHQYSTVALLDALEREGATDVRVYFYANHVPQAGDSPVGAADGIASLPPFFDSTLGFEGVHSLPLDRALLVRKAFALETMHALRRTPPMPWRQWRQDRISLTEGVRDLLWGRGMRQFSYFRLALRPNELFFVYSLPGALALRDEFLARDRPKIEARREAAAVNR